MTEILVSNALMGFTHCLDLKYAIFRITNPRCMHAPGTVIGRAFDCQSCTIRFDDRVFEIPAGSGILTNHFEFGRVLEQCTDHNWIQSMILSLHYLQTFLKLMKNGEELTTGDELN